jgi:uncharacterized protein CbrC (UPF0167 family)
MAEPPKFRYHPDPVSTGSVEKCDDACGRCGLARGYIYVGPVYCEQEPTDAICPWCIADGSAAEALDAEFSDPHPLAKANLDPKIIDSVTKRTPGYTTWQGEEWQACCQDACAFLGDAEQADLKSLPTDERQRLLARMGLDEEELVEIVENYQVGGSPAFYKFKCLHCGKLRFAWDCD